MMNKKTYDQQDIYLPDFKFEQVAGISLGLIVAVVLLIFIVTGVIQLLEGTSITQIIQAMPIFDFLFFVPIFGGAYYYLIYQKGKVEEALQTALYSGSIIEGQVVTVKLSEARGRTQDSDFGNQHPAFDKKTFHTVQVNYQGQMIELPHIPFIVANQLVPQQVVRILYSAKHPNIGFLLKEQTN